MRTITTIFIFVMFVVPDIFGQGTFVFGNGEAGVCAPVFDNDQKTLLEGPRYQAQLWYRLADTDEPFIPHSETVGFDTGTRAGFFRIDNFLISIPGITSRIDAKVRVWDTQTGESWETATRRWNSNVIQIQLVSGGAPPANMIGLDFTKMQIRHSAEMVVITWPDPAQIDPSDLCSKTYFLEVAETVEGPWAPFSGEMVIEDNIYKATLEPLEQKTLFFRMRVQD